MAQPCSECNTYIKAHGAFQLGFLGQQQTPVQNVADHEYHKHGTRVCEDCKQPFNAVHHSFGDPDPSAPAEPILIAVGKMVLVHKRCLKSYEAKRAAGIA